MTSCFVARIFNPGERFGKPFYEVDVPRPLKDRLKLQRGSDECATINQSHNNDFSDKPQGRVVRGGIWVKVAVVDGAFLTIMKVVGERATLHEQVFLTTPFDDSGCATRPLVSPRSGECGNGFEITSRRKRISETLCGSVVDSLVCGAVSLACCRQVRRLLLIWFCRGLRR